MNRYNFTSNSYIDFEDNNPFISLIVYDKYGHLLHKSLNNSNNKAYIVNFNNQRYHALKRNKDRYIQLKELLKQFTHKELKKYALNKIVYYSLIVILGLLFRTYDLMSFFS